jgi:hypothetical protein
MIDDVGFYTVGNEKFYNKIHAMFRAQQLNTEPEWNFNDEVFSKFDWTVEPTESLDELYAIRARQIREKYDYVLMFVSGGADSTNMVFAFLDNGLHIDEIVASAPISGLRDWDRNSVKDSSVENTIEETFLTQIPFLQKIQKNYPRIKVTLHDYFEDMLAYKQDDWLLKGTDWMHPSMAGRYNLDRYLHLKRIAESGKKIAVVQGLDKPQMAKLPNCMAIIMQDTTYNNKYDSIKHPNTFPVFFYHSPDLPQLIIKQAHVTARYLLKPENSLLAKVMPYNYEEVKDIPPDLLEVCNGNNNGIYERGIVPAIYPSIKKWSYQAGKPDKMFLGKHDYWFYKHHQGTDVYKMMQSDLNNLITSIDKKFLVYRPAGLLGFKSYRKRYIIGLNSKFVTNDALLLDNLISDIPKAKVHSVFELK